MNQHAQEEVHLLSGAIDPDDQIRLLLCDGWTISGTQRAIWGYLLFLHVQY